MQNALQSIPGLYPKDPFFSRLHQCPDRYNKFESHKEYLWTKNRQGKRVVCVLGGMLNGKSIRGSIIDACHTTLGHLGPQKMLEYVRHWFWWPKISADIEDFCKSCRHNARCRSPPDSAHLAGYTQCLSPENPGKASAWTSLAPTQKSRDSTMFS